MLTNVPSQSTPTSNATNWIPDSGASFHVTGESQNIQNIESFEGPDQIFVGNGQGLPIAASGSSSFISPYNTKISSSLEHLLHVPNITKNLVSVSQYAGDDGVFFEFHCNYCAVKS